MPLRTRYLFSAAMDVDPSKDALFHEVYDKEHIPALLEVPGVVSASRFKLRDLTMMIGGERKTMDPQGATRYKALYEQDLGRLKLMYVASRTQPMPTPQRSSCGT